MIIDSQRDLPDLGKADVCIIGAGAAGIALAVELAQTPLKVFLVDQGGLPPNGSGPPIYKVMPGSRISLGLNAMRRFLLGGNTVYWYGNNRPLDAADFEPRSWIPNSGWPIRRDDLLPYYERAQAASGLGAFHWYDVDACRPLLDEVAQPLDSSVLETKIVQVTPEPNFAALHATTLAEAPNVTVISGLHVVRLEARGDRIVAAEAVRPDGTPVSLAAERFVLAGGGIENPRILMASTELMAGAASSVSDSVGRYFQEHLYYRFETDLTDSPHFRRSRRLHLYNAGVGRELEQLGSYRSKVGDAFLWAQLVISDAVAREQKLPGVAFWLSPAPPREMPEELSALKDALRRPLQLPRAALRVARHPFENFGFAWRKLMGKPSPPGKLRFVMQVEQFPDPDSTLTPRTDAPGPDQPQLELTTELSPTLRASHAKALMMAAAELGFDGPTLVKEMERKYAAGEFDYFWHHMGTTRMGTDPKRSVVDADCKVHGVSNLFVAGSSVFPTTGTAGPTLSIVALAIRLADHLRGR